MRDLRIGDTATGPRAVGRIDCPDGWAAARMLLAAAIEDSQTPGARQLAAELRDAAPDDRAFALAIQDYVRRRVAFVPERGEVFQGADHTLGSAVGDCDDHFRVVYAIAAAGGLPAVLALLHHGGRHATPTHAAAMLCPDGGACEWAETTVPADFGEHPLAAAERLGLVDARADLAREVRIMGERDLPAAPARYLEVNPPELVARDVRALERLGFICDPPERADDPAFRAAVAEFQTAHGLVVDGLIGPQTRAAIAGALPDGERDEYLAIDASAPKHTRDLPDAFFAALRRGAADLGFAPEWMLDIMWAESAVNPAAKYRRLPDLATGLIGFVNLPVHGIAPDNSLESHDAFARLSALEQLPFALRFWRGMKGKAASAANLYQYNFVPASLARGTSPDTVVVGKGGTGYGGKEARFYEVNRILDVDNDGAITVADLERHLERQKRTKAGVLYPRYAEALARLGATPPDEGDGAGSGSGVAATIVGGLFVLAAVGAAVAAVRG